MKTIITVKGTHCNACQALIEDIANDIKGIHACAVDFTTGKTEIEYDKDANLQEFKKEVEELGNYAVMLKDT